MFMSREMLIMDISIHVITSISIIDTHDERIMHCRMQVDEMTKEPVESEEGLHLILRVA